MLTEAQLESILQFPDYGGVELLVRELRRYRKGYELAHDVLDFLFDTDNRSVVTPVNPERCYLVQKHKK